MNEEHPDNVSNVDLVVHIFLKDVSHQAQVPTMLGTVFESVVVTLYKGLAVYRLEAVEFTDEGELLFEMFHRGAPPECWLRECISGKIPKL
jgi:hypothetical protein